MSIKFNNCTFAGYVARDAKLHNTRREDSRMMTFTLGVFDTPSKHKDKADVHWVKCVMYGVRADALYRYVAKGTPVLVSGRLHTYSYDKDGETKHGWDIVLSDLQLLGNGKSEFGSSGGGSAKHSHESEFVPSIDDSDLPF